MNQFLKADLFDENLTFGLPDSVIRQILRDMHGSVSNVSAWCYEAKSTWNQVICGAHRLQLSVRKVLDLSSVNVSSIFCGRLANFIKSHVWLHRT